jgi:phage terminase small subunit
MTELTKKQQKFCNEYLKDFNGTRAYRIAYDTCKSDETAKAGASRLLTYDNIKAYINKRREQQNEKAIITQEMILEELKKIIRSDKQEECTSNRLKAMELAGKHLGMFKETNMNVNMSYEDYLNKVADDDDY